MSRGDIYMLTCNEPYEVAGRPPVNATIVHARTLLHPDLPQPDGGMLYRCLVERSHRIPGEVVPVATLTYELDGGRLWAQVADWFNVTLGVAELVRAEKCDGMPMYLPPSELNAVAMGPNTKLVTILESGQALEHPSDYRRSVIDKLQGYVADFVSTGAFWPGNGLVGVPTWPEEIPYQPV